VTGLANDRRRSTVHPESLGVDAAAFLRPIEHDARGLRDADPLRGDARLPDQKLELVDVFALAGAHI